MQFSFKRPQTSKVSNSLPSHLTREKSPQTQTNSKNLMPSKPDDGLKKWQQAAQKINREMAVLRTLHSQSDPYKLLTKIGGRTFNSQPKQTNFQQSNKPKIRVTSKQKKNRQTMNQSRFIRQVQESQHPNISNTGLSDTKLKRKKRGQNFRGNPLDREIKITNIFYENPVIKIGYNMQFEANLIFQHISQIKPDHGGTICRNSIIFFLKDAPFSPNIISQKNQKVPICLSLFPEFFDSKLSVSHKKREIYLNRMIILMNNTYDPQRMSQIPKFSNYPPYKSQPYMKAAQELITMTQEDYPAQLIEGITKKIKIKLDPATFRAFVNQQWQFWALANAMSTLDYALKDPKTFKRLKVVPYLPTRVITAKKILYHGGYCKSLYISWNNYVQNGRSKLSSKLNKYHNTIQVIHGWYTQFEDLILYQPYFIQFFQRAVPIDLYRSLQLIKIKHSIRFLQELWLRGALCLLHYKRYLQKQKDQYRRIIDYKKELSDYIAQAKKRQVQFNTSELKNNFYSTSYDNFIGSLRKQAHIQSIQELIQGDTYSSGLPNLHSTQVLLNIQFSNTIQKSFLSLRNQIMFPNNPIIKLNLTVDRQTIKFIQQEQDIVNIFLQIIGAIFNTKLEGFSLSQNFSSKSKANQITKLVQTSLQKNVESTLYISEYPQIRMDKLEHKGEKITINYKTSFNFDFDIRDMVERIRQYYRECYIILNKFESYLPFIKLTTTQKLFGEGEGPAQTAFLKNLKIINRYKQSITKIQKRIKINLFEVDCSVPIQTLQQRINEIQYIIQQNYINIIHQKIEAMDSELNTLKIGIYDVGVNLGGDQAEEKLFQLKNKMIGLKDKSKRVAEMIMFCLDNKRKMETIVNCFCQLVFKKQQLQKDLQKLFINLQMKIPELQAQKEAQITQAFANIDSTIKTLNETEATPFQIANLSQHLILLNNIQTQLTNLENGMGRWQQWAKKMSFKPNYEEKIKLFQQQKERFALAEQFWEEFYRFTIYFKEIAKIQARKINHKQFIERVAVGESIVEKVKTTQQHWWQSMPDKSHWKPIIHRTHDFYNKKFQNELRACNQMQFYLQILTNKKIKDRHWQIYDLQEFKQITCRELTRLQPNYKIHELTTMNNQVNFEYEIFLGYEGIQKKIRQHSLIIVDLNNSDILDLQNMKQCVQFLYNVEIDIAMLQQKDKKGYYWIELQSLLQITQITQLKLKNWHQIESKYIKYLKYHIVNEQHQLLLFQNLMQLHRKLIKSYDIDNSILFISKNIVMDTYLTQISGELQQLDRKIHSNLVTVRQEYPRLYLLSDQQLFNFMSSQTDIQHYLLRLFPHILKFHAQEGSIQKVGLGQEIVFSQPLYYQEIAGRVSNWVSTLQQNIKLRMKQFYKTGVMLSQGRPTNQIQQDFYEKRPIQLSILQRCLRYTEEVLQKGLLNNTQTILTEIQAQIQINSKQKRQVNMILLLILLRQWTLKLQQAELDSFQWVKIPHFVRKGSQLQPAVVILTQQYNYGFNFLQESQLIFTPVILTGNCIIGEEMFGKTAILKHYAYFCGQQLLQFNPLALISAESSTAIMLNYFRVAISIGCWLFIKRIDRMMQEELALVAQCMIIVNQGLQQQLQKISINGLQLNLNKNIKVFMSLLSLNDCQIPARLVQHMRPLWIPPPNKGVLLSVYLQSKCVVNAECGKLLKFLSWLQYHGELKLQILDWIRREQNPDIFVGSCFLRRIIDLNLFKTPQCQLMLQNLRKQDCNLSGIEYQQEEYDLELINRSQVLVVYGPQGCGKTKAIVNKLQKNFILLDRDSFATQGQFYSYFICLQAGRHENSKSTSLVLKNSLAYWPYIKRYLRNFRVVLIQQDLSQLHIGILHRQRMLDYNRVLHQKVEVKHPNIMQLILPQLIPQSQINNDIYQLINNPASNYSKLVTKLEMTLNENTYPAQSQHQLAINFFLLFRKMIVNEYQPAMAFVYSIIWNYGFVINQKLFQEILRQVSQPDSSGGKAKFARLPSEQAGRVLSKKKLEQHLGMILKECLSNKNAPLTELVPSKSGKFLSNSEVASIQGIAVQCQLFNGLNITFKSSLIHNITLVRSLFPGAILINSKDWLTTLLKSCTQGSRYCNFGCKDSAQIFDQFFVNTQKQGPIFKLTNKKIIIDDIHLSSQHSLSKLKDLVQYNFVIIKKGSKFDIFRTHELEYTVGSKMDLPTFQKALVIKLNELLITTIFNQFIQGYCQKHLEIDRSIFSILNLFSNINRIYKQQQQEKYFWFKNPLILSLYIKSNNITQFIQTYFQYLAEILPQESASLQVQKNLLQLQPKPRTQKKINGNENTVNTTQKYLRLLNEHKILDELLADNEILEQIQSKDIESFYFQKFIKQYFTKQVINYTKKIRLYMQHHHLLILHDHSPPLNRIIKYATKLAKKNLYQFSQEDSVAQNSIITLDLEQADQQILEKLKIIIQDNQKTHKYIIKADLASSKTRHLFETFSFLKSRFFNIVIKSFNFHDRSQQIKPFQPQISSNQSAKEKFQIKIKPGEWDKDRELEKLIKEENLDNRFRQQFLRSFQIVHKIEFQKFLFYRQITNEMAVTITDIKGSLQTIPNYISQLRSRQTSIKASRKKMRQECNQLTQKMKHWQQYQKISSDVIRYKIQQETNSLQKLLQNSQPIHSKLDKIERKIEAIQNVEYVRLKNNLKNNQYASSVQNLHNILAYLSQKGQSLPNKEKMIVVASTLTTPSALASFLRAIRLREDYSCDIQQRSIKTAFSFGRIKYFLIKLEEIQSNIKKYEKASLIYKSVLSWLTLFRHFCTQLEQYFNHQEQINSRVFSELGRISPANRFQQPIQKITQQIENINVQAKRNSIQCQQKLYILENMLQNQEKQEQKTKVLQNFYDQRLQRLQKVESILSKSEYMKKVSSGVSLYFRDIQKIVFSKTLSRVSLLQYQLDQNTDAQLIKGLFTFREDVFNLKRKIAVNGPLNELQILIDLIQEPIKSIAFVEDKEGLFKNKLVQLGELKGYFVKQFKYNQYEDIYQWIVNKISQSQKIIVLHENIHYLQSHRQQNLQNCHVFSQKLLKLQKKYKKSFILYIANYLPEISGQLYSRATVGRILVSRQRLFNDICQSFEIIFTRQKDRENAKKRSDMEQIIKQRNQKMKNILKQVDNLSKQLRKQNWLQIEPQQKVQIQKQSCLNLENYIMNLQNLQEQLNFIQKCNCSFYYLPSHARVHIDKELNRYYLLYKLTQFFNIHTNNQLSYSKDLYVNWISLLKQLRQEKLSLFTRSDHRPIINQISIKSQHQKPKLQENKSRQKQQPEQDSRPLDMVLAPNFRKHNTQIFNQLVQKIIKTANWLQRANLIQYTLGVSALLSLTRCNLKSKTIQNYLLKRPLTYEIIEEKCRQVLSLSERLEYSLSSFTFSYLQQQLNKLVNSGHSAQQLQAAILLGLYYNSILIPSITNDASFVLNFDRVLNERETFSLKYGFLRFAYSLKLSGEIAIRYAPPLSLSLNFEFIQMQRQRLITILEEEKCLLNELVQVLKIKALSKKRQLIIYLVDLQKKNEALETICNLYKGSGKYWILLPNLAVRRREHQVGKFLQQILQKLHCLPANPSFKMFLVWTSQKQNQNSFYYNKFEVSRLKGSQQITDQMFYKTINQQAIETLVSGAISKSKRRALIGQQDSNTPTLGHSLMQQLIIKTIGENKLLPKQKLQAILVFYKKVSKKYSLFQYQDTRIFYKRLISELLKLGFLQDETDLNFCEFLADYFSSIPGISAAMVKNQIQVQQELCKEGLFSTFIFNTQQKYQQKVVQNIFLQKINVQRIEQYFKNIGYQFVQLLKREIQVNNCLLGLENTWKQLRKAKNMPKSIQNQIWYTYLRKFRNRDSSGSSLFSIKDRLPLLRLLSNIKLKQICTTKKIQILNAEQFYIFITAWQFRLVRQFTMQRINPDQVRQSSVQFENYIHTRDYLSKLKLLLIGQQDDQKIPLVQQEITHYLQKNQKIQARFVLAVRKGQPLKIVELNYQQNQVDLILKHYTCVLVLGTELMIELSSK